MFFQKILFPETLSRLFKHQQSNQIKAKNCSPSGKNETQAQNKQSYKINKFHFY